MRRVDLGDGEDEGADEPELNSRPRVLCTTSSNCSVIARHGAQRLVGRDDRARRPGARVFGPARWARGIVVDLSLAMVTGSETGLREQRHCNDLRGGGDRPEDLAPVTGRRRTRAPDDVLSHSLLRDPFAQLKTVGPAPPRKPSQMVPHRNLRTSCQRGEDGAISPSASSRHGCLPIHRRLPGRIG